ncbi:unnamed protein product, partial [Staurois parvus]
MSHFVIFKFPSVPSPYVPTLTGDGTQMTDAGIRRRRWPGTLQEGHRGSAGQGKRRTDIGAALHGKPECSSGLPLLLHSGILSGRL